MKTGMDSSKHLKEREKLEIKRARMTFRRHLHFPGVLKLELLIALVCLNERILSSELLPFSESSFSRMAALASL